MVRCAACGTVGASQRCGACRYAQYCNAVCQRGHWKAGHKEECKSICAAIPLRAEDMRSLSLPGLVDFICSPGVLVADSARLAAKLLVQFHKKRPLSKELSMRVTKGFLDVVERLLGERTALIEAPCEAIFTVIHPGFINIFFDEGGMTVIVRALRAALGYTSSSADAPADDDESSEVDFAVSWLLCIVEYVVNRRSDRATRVLVDNDALPLVVAALRKYSSDNDGVLKSGCEIFAAVAYFNSDCRSTIVTAGAVPVLLQAILQPGRSAPLCAFDAISIVIEPSDVGRLNRATIAEAVRHDLTRIVDATFCALTSLFDFDKDNADDVAMLTHTGRMIASTMLYLSPGHGVDDDVNCGAARAASTIMSFSVLLFGDGEPGRLPALVNALRATIHGIADIVNLEHIAGAFASAISLAIDGAGWASTRAAVEAGAIPALLAAVRKLGDSSDMLIYGASVALRKLQLRAREGCCPERIVAELSMRGTTPKLLRRLRDVWKSKVVSAAAAAAGADRDYEVAKREGTISEMIVDELSALLADMPSSSHA